MSNLENPQANEDIEIEKRVLNNLVEFLGLPKKATTKEMYLKFFEEDQKIMNSKGTTDYLDPLNEVSKIKNLLTEYEANINPEKMNKDIKHILALYYHHASQFEFNKNNKEIAVEYIDKALKFKDPNINQITGLLALLFRGQINEAEEYITRMTSSEVETAKSLLTHFKKNYA